MKRPCCRERGATPHPQAAVCAECGAALAGTPVDLAPLRGRRGRGLAAILLVVMVVVGAALATGLGPRASSAARSSQALTQSPSRLSDAVLALSGASDSDPEPASSAFDDSTDASPTPGTSLWEGVRQAVVGVPDTISGVAADAQSATTEPLTIVLLGVDARPGEAIEVGVRADAILLLHLDPEARSCRLLAVPRDSRAELPGHGLSKINHALAVGGIPYQIQVIEGFLGLDIDRYALANFQAFATVVDAIGGISLTVTEPFTMDDVSFEPGERWLNGADALAYVRYRGGADGDFGRIARQQQVLRAIAAQASGLDLARGAPGIFSAIEEHLRTDLSLVEISGLIAYYQPACGADQIELASLTGETATFPDPLVGQELSYVVVSDANKAEQVAWLLGEPR